MATFNAKRPGMKTFNLNDHPAYRLSEKEKLATQVLTSFMNEPKYYGDNTPSMVKLAGRVAALDGEFVAKLALYARQTMNMRSTSHMLCAVLAHQVKGEPFVRRAIAACIVRGDDVTEILSAYMALYPGQPVPNSLRRGLKDALDRLDDYSIAKYQMRGREVTMADAIKICHPAPREVFKACIENRLPVPEGWEVALSRDGNNQATWEKLIDDDAVPYMAMLRNLRNIILAQPRNLAVVPRKLSDPEAVRKSRQLPFRFYSAYRSVEHIASMKVLDALETAADISLENCPRFKGTTVVAVDTSGSMRNRLSRDSEVLYRDVAALLGLCVAMLSEDCVVYTFDSEACHVGISSRGGLLSQMDKLHGNGGWTDMGAVFGSMKSDCVDCDRIVILSDNEVNWGKNTIQTLADEYRNLVGHPVWVHAADMAGYGTTQFIGSRTSIVAGWSEKIIPLMAYAERGVGGMIQEIEATPLP